MLTICQISYIYTMHPGVQQWAERDVTGKCPSCLYGLKGSCFLVFPVARKASGCVLPVCKTGEAKMIGSYLRPSVVLYNVC